MHWKAVSYCVNLNRYLNNMHTCRSNNKYFSQSMDEKWIVLVIGNILRECVRVLVLAHCPIITGAAAARILLLQPFKSNIALRYTRPPYWRKYEREHPLRRTSNCRSANLCLAPESGYCDLKSIYKNSLIVTHEADINCVQVILQ